VKPAPILVIDDNTQNLKLTRVLLTHFGYEVHTAIDAEQALKVLEAFAPKLILMDLQLPGMDGLALTRQLKQDARTRNIVIVALTAYAMKGDRERALAAGCDDYVTKPIDTKALPVLIAKHLESSAARMAN
jgi:two-component system cell cycle response regulator DivK